ncbi:hypothetical protein PUN28_001272 [Cardiocondyla obscurior]|uniref:Uncharacterized protein n=1 Tax=Cardiocondyla obscurior TaxID=286306 RepID=A0AAW2H445_9HYME
MLRANHSARTVRETLITDTRFSPSRVAMTSQGLVSNNRGVRGERSDAREGDKVSRRGEKKKESEKEGGGGAHQGGDLFPCTPLPSTPRRDTRPKFAFFTRLDGRAGRGPKRVRRACRRGIFNHYRWRRIERANGSALLSPISLPSFLFLSLRPFTRRGVVRRIPGKKSKKTTRNNEKRNITSERVHRLLGSRGRFPRSTRRREAGNRRTVGSVERRPTETLFSEAIPRCFRRETAAKGACKGIRRISQAKFPREETRLRGDCPGRSRALSSRSDLIGLDRLTGLINRSITSSMKSLDLPGEDVCASLGYLPLRVTFCSPSNRVVHRNS